MPFIEGLKRMIDRQLDLGKQEDEQKKIEIANLFNLGEQLHLIIHGRVQGVFFRDFVLKEAQKLSINGFVRNMPNGTVEVIAQGNKPALDELLALCRQGPSRANVEKIDVIWENSIEKYSYFEQKQTS